MSTFPLVVIFIVFPSKKTKIMLRISSNYNIICLTLTDIHQKKTKQNKKISFLKKMSN